MKMFMLFSATSACYESLKLCDHYLKGPTQEI